MFRKAFAAPLAAIALMAAAPAPSIAMASNDQGNSSVTQSDQGNGETPKQERKICKSFDQSGSHMRAKRLCLTQAQWREFNATQE
jgi:hypothetical protein